MQLPKIDLGILPDLETVTGIFGSMSPTAGPGHDDRVVIIMVYVYDMIPPERLF